MLPNATSMTIPACIDNTTVANWVETFFYFWRSTSPWACPRTRPPFERPACTRAHTGTVSSSKSGTLTAFAPMEVGSPKKIKKRSPLVSQPVCGHFQPESSFK